jgi:hypothetical protein
MRSQKLNIHQIKEALELLIMAGLVIPVTHTSANGNDYSKKIIFPNMGYLFFVCIFGSSIMKIILLSNKYLKSYYILRILIQPFEICFQF